MFNILQKEKEEKTDMKNKINAPDFNVYGTKGVKLRLKFVHILCKMCQFWHAAAQVAQDCSHILSKILKPWYNFTFVYTLS